MANYVKNYTVIISLLNGVTSEEIISKKYGWKNLPIAYYIGHSAMRDGNNITHDGVGTIVFGINDTTKTSEECIERIKKYFDKAKIEYKIPKDMPHAYWLKYMLNVSSNQPSAILRMTFGDMQSNKKFMEFLVKIMKEVQAIAKAEGIKNTDKMIDEALKSFSKMTADGKPSTLQDVEGHRKTEVDMFAGTMIEFGKKHNIPTPYNMVLKDMLEVIQEGY